MKDIVMKFLFDKFFADQIIVAVMFIASNNVADDVCQNRDLRSELKVSNKEEFTERNVPMQTVCPICSARIITVVRKRWQCKPFICSFRRPVHFCPICDNVISGRYLLTRNKSSTLSSS